MLNKVVEVDCPFGGKTDVHVLGDRWICLRCDTSNHQFIKEKPECENTAGTKALQEAQTTDISQQ